MVIESKKTILFLIQSCNREDFLNEEFVVKETWAKDVIDGKYSNIDYWTIIDCHEDSHIDLNKH